MVRIRRSTRAASTSARASSRSLSRSPRSTRSRSSPVSFSSRSEAYSSRNHTLRTSMRVDPSPATNTSELREQLLNDEIDGLGSVVPVLAQLWSHGRLHHRSIPGVKLTDFGLGSEVRVADSERCPKAWVGCDLVVHCCDASSNLVDVRRGLRAELVAQVLLPGVVELGIELEEREASA